MQNNFLNHFPTAGSYIFLYLTVVNNSATNIFVCGVFSILKIQTLFPGGLVKSPSLTSLVVTQVWGMLGT